MWYPKAEGEYPRRDNSKRGLPSQGWDCNHWVSRKQLSETQRGVDKPHPVAWHMGMQREYK